MNEQVRPRLADLLQRIPPVELQAGDMRGTVLEMMEAMVQSSVLTAAQADGIRERIYQREEGGGTAFGGFAGPHIWCATELGITKPLAVLGRSKTGIEWNGGDGMLVHVVVFVLAPSAMDTLHLRTEFALAAAALGVEPLLAAATGDISKLLAQALEEGEGGQGP